VKISRQTIQNEKNIQFKSFTVYAFVEVMEIRIFFDFKKKFFVILPQNGDFA